jgi:hypothetical protein
VRPTGRQWPPLVIAASRPLWTRVRDVVVTILAWLALAVLLNREIEFGLASYLGDYGMGALVDRRQMGELGGRLGWSETVAHLAPYVTIAAFLVAFLCGFGLHTLLRRRRALQAPRPQPLSLAREARQAGLVHRSAAGNSQDTGGSAEDEIVSGPDLLAMLNAQDRAALVAVRRLRIATIEVNAGGHYRIVDGQALASNAPKRLQADPF